MKFKGINSVMDPDFYTFKEEIHSAFKEAWLDCHLNDQNLLVKAANLEIEEIVPPLELHLYDEVRTIVYKYF
jgi:hypothetical protein